VLGDDAAPGLVARLAGLDAADSAAAVDSLVRLGFLAAGDPHRPAHPLVAAAVEGSMTAAEGERAHLGAAALLYAGGHPAGEIAEHLLLVTVPDAPWTAEVLRSAADTAMGQGRPVPAARYLRRALLGSPAAGPQRAAVLVDLATAERGLDAVAAERHIMQAAMMLPTAGERAAAVVRVAPSTVSSYFNDLLLRVADEVGNPDTLTGADQELALLLEARCRSIRARDHFTFESAVKRLDELGAEPAVATAGQRQLLAVLLHSSMEGKMLPAAQVARLAGPIVAAQPPSPEHVHTTLPLLVPTLLAADAAGQLVPWLGTALEQVRRRQEPVPHARIAAEQALAHLALGDLSGAQAYATEACDVADEYAPGEAAEAAVVLGAVALEAGDAVLADQVLARQDARRGHPHEPGSGEGTLLLLNALVTLDRDDPRGALDHVLDCAQLLQRLGWRNTALHPWRAWAAYLYLRLGDRAAALAVAAEEVRQAREWGAPAGIGRALLVTAMVTGGEQAIEISQEAAVVLQESQNSLLRARVLVDLGQRLHATGRRAEKPLRLGYHLAVKCGAALLAGQARQSLTEAGLAGEPLTLTRTERRVAAFAAAGHTNRQIAGDLEVSLRAVEKHLTSVYRKLGASGRAQLADALRALELEASLTPGGEAGRRRDSREFRPRER
jgi:DNA-binding CsgD family transcriptional regulator